MYLLYQKICYNIHMSKRGIKIHQKGESSGLYQAARMSPGAKNSGNKQVRKPKQSKKS